MCYLVDLWRAAFIKKYLNNEQVTLFLALPVYLVTNNQELILLEAM